MASPQTRQPKVAVRVLADRLVAAVAYGVAALVPEGEEDEDEEHDESQ